MSKTERFEKPLIDGKRHDNPHHAGQRSHRLRQEIADSTFIEAFDLYQLPAIRKVRIKIGKQRG